MNKNTASPTPRQQIESLLVYRLVRMNRRDINSYMNNEVYMSDLAYDAAKTVGELHYYMSISDRSYKLMITSVLQEVFDRTFHRLDNPNQTFRQWRNSKAEALSQVEDPRAVEPLIEELRDHDWQVREQAAQSLGKLGDARAVQPLVEALGDSDWRVREGAAQALIQIGDPAVAALIRAFEDYDSQVRVGAIRILAQMKDTRAVEPLISALRTTSHWYTRSVAAAALGDLGDVRAVEPLRAELRSLEWHIRRSAAIALGKLCG